MQLWLGSLKQQRIFRKLPDLHFSIFPCIRQHQITERVTVKGLSGIKSRYVLSKIHNPSFLIEMSPHTHAIAQPVIYTPCHRISKLRMLYLQIITAANNITSISIHSTVELHLVYIANNHNRQVQRHRLQKYKDFYHLMYCRRLTISYFWPQYNDEEKQKRWQITKPKWRKNGLGRLQANLWGHTHATQKCEKSNPYCLITS